MAVTTESSDQLTNQEASPVDMLNPRELHGRLRIAYFEFTQGAAAGDAGSYQRLIKLPAGKVRLILPLSRIAFSAFGAARTLDLGWEAHVQADGTAVVADPNGLDDGVDVSAAGSVNPGGTVGGAETYEFDSQEGVVIAAQTNDGTIPAAATLKGYLVYVVD